MRRARRDHERIEVRPRSHPRADRTRSRSALSKRPRLGRHGNVCSCTSIASPSPSTTRSAPGSSYPPSAERSSFPTVRTSSLGLATVGRRRAGPCSSTRGNSRRSGQAALALRRARRCPTNPNPPQRTAGAPEPADRLTSVSTFVSTVPGYDANRPCLRAIAGCDTRNHKPGVGGSSPSAGQTNRADRTLGISPMLSVQTRVADRKSREETLRAGVRQ